QQGKSREQLIKLLELALQSFDQAAICTIHSFCQRALAESPFAAGMPFSTEIVQDDREELTEVVNDFWRRKLGVAAEQAPDQDFAQLLLDRGDTPEKFRRLLSRHVGKPKAKLKWPEQNGVDRVAALTRATQLFEEAKRVWRDHAAELRELLAGANLKATHNAEKLAEAFAECDRYFALPQPEPKVGARLKRLCATSIAKAVRS